MKTFNESITIKHNLTLLEQFFVELKKRNICPVNFVEWLVVEQNCELNEGIGSFMSNVFGQQSGSQIGSVQKALEDLNKYSKLNAYRVQKLLGDKDFGATIVAAINALRSQSVAESVGLCESVHPNMIEYVTRDLFKGKSVTSACRAFVKKFHGSENMFLGGKVDVTEQELADAVFEDKANNVINFIPKVKPGKEDYALKSAVQLFRLNPNDAARLRVEVVKKLGHDPFGKSESTTENDLTNSFIEWYSNEGINLQGTLFTEGFYDQFTGWLGNKTGWTGWADKQDLQATINLINSLESLNKNTNLSPNVKSQVGSAIGKLKQAAEYFSKQTGQALPGASIVDQLKAIYQDDNFNAASNAQKAPLRQKARQIINTALKNKQYQELAQLSSQGIDLTELGYSNIAR